MKKQILLMVAVLLTVLFVFAEETKEKQFTEKEYEEALKKEEVNYNSNLPKMNGNIDAYCIVYDYMGRGYVKLDTDVIIQIANFESNKSQNFKLSFSAKDDSNFSVKKDWSFKRSEIYVNKEGDGLVIKKLSLEKGKYNNIQITLTGDANENAILNIPEYTTLQLSDLKVKNGQLFLISSMNEIRNPMFMRRDYVIVPHLTGRYDKSKTMGFYFEYYHITADALYKEGKYEIKYKLLNVVFDKVIFEQTISKDEVKENGAVIVPPVDLTEAFPGIYKLIVEFKDVMGNVTMTHEKMFYIYKTTKEPAK